MLAIICAACTPATAPGPTVFALSQPALPESAVDVVFVPDDDYGDMAVLADRQVFLDDATGMIENGFRQNNAIAVNLGAYNFWYMDQTGDVSAGSGICPSVDWPDLDDAAFAELIILLHPAPLRDCANGNRVTTEPENGGTAVHEHGHAVFSLPDEYCCDGGYWEEPPVLYNSEIDCTGDPANAAWRDCISFTDSDGDVWWRSEGDNGDIMFNDGDSLVPEFGQADWVVMQPVLGGLGGSGGVSPSIFAPNSWDWP
jgi:hypothetical protein